VDSSESHLDEVAAQLKEAIGDRYALERELGRGGMAVVYLARDLKHDRAVALKILRPELGALLGAERFLREIKTVAGLQHPHILPLYDSGESCGTLYYVMPFVSGESLRDRIRKQRQLPIKDALRITREVADALHYAHSKDIVHRDIKPENILLSGSHAVVTDFGIARAIHVSGGEQWETLTESGVALGTPAYMSPEQTAGERELDARSDIYSLGCVLYEMLTGDPPFAGPDGQVMLARRFSEPAPSARLLRADTPESVDQALAIALAREPTDRFANSLDFVDAIWGDREYVQHVTGRQRQREEREQQRSRKRSRWAMAGAASLGAVAIAALVTVLASGSGGIRALRNSLFPGGTLTTSPAETTPPPVAEPPAAPPPVSQPAPTQTAVIPPAPKDTTRPAVTERPAPERRPPAATRTDRPSRADVARANALRDSARIERARAVQAGGVPTELATGDSVMARAEDFMRRGRLDDAEPQFALARVAWINAAQSARLRRQAAESVARAAAPAPVQPAPPPAEPPPERRESDARAAIDAVIMAYARAIESRDVGAIRQRYPGLTATQERDWQIFFRSVRDVKVTLTIAERSIDGSAAQVRARGTYRYENVSTRRHEEQPLDFSATLRLTDRGWTISEIR
jgi:serine/threonine protein kinase